MADDYLFRWALGLVVLITVAILLPFRFKAASSGERISKEEEGRWMAVTLRGAGLLLWFSTFAYLFFPSWVAWAAMPLPVGLRWFGLLAVAICCGLFYWTLHELGKNLTDTVVTRRNAVLVTSGPYRWVRHPYYVVSALLMASVTLVTANALIGASSLFVISLLVIRTPKEEEKLAERFGTPYRDYMAVTGRFLPRFFGTPRR